MKTLWNKIKLMWQGRKVAESLISIKSKWKEPTFWVSLLGNALSLVATYKGMVPPSYAKWLIVANSVLTAGYNYVRGLQKAESDGVKPFSKSSEVWLGLATMVNNAFIDMHTGGIATPFLAGGTVVVGHAIAAARDLANMRPKEVVAAGATNTPVATGS